jgi:hypothetical protein
MVILTIIFLIIIYELNMFGFFKFVLVNIQFQRE